MFNLSIGNNKMVHIIYIYIYLLLPLGNLMSIIVPSVLILGTMIPIWGIEASILPPLSTLASNIPPVLL